MENALEAHLLHQAEGATRFFWHRLRWRFVREHLPAHPFTLLDVGAGIGAVGELLRSERPDVTYTFDEPIESLRAHLVERFGISNDLHGVASCPEVEVVTLLDVIEHIDDDQTFLRALVDRLESGSRIIVTVPASMRYWSRWDVSLGHHRRYEPASFDALLASAPVDVVETGHLFPEMVPAAWWRARRSPAPVPATGATLAPGDDDAAEFPELPAFVDRALYLAGLPGVRWRRTVPIGTSLCAVLRVR